VHELPITQSMLDIVVEKARESGAEKVTKINTVIGALSGVEKSCVQFYFDCLKTEYGLSEAALDITSVPVLLKCRSCGREFASEELPWSCPGCQGYSVTIIKGNECYVESIEVE
jgi:hydrogenase nickel incorporation protein HypA/HybF